MLMITKIDLVKILWGVTEGDDKCTKIRTERTLNGEPLWSKGDWIFVKDIEVSLKRILEEMKSRDIDFEGDFVEGLFSKDIDPQLRSNEYLLEKVKECRESIKMLENDD
jgi:hypothetical protein